MPGRTSATLTVDIPDGSPRTTWRMSKYPLGTQTGWYRYTYRSGDDVRLSISTGTLDRGTRYYYQIESGTRSNVVATGTFTTQR